MMQLNTLIVICSICICSSSQSSLPLVIATWDYIDAVTKGRDTLLARGSPLDAVENGVNLCELNQCRGSVGFGGHPDESGETTLDAFIMDGVTHDTGSVSCLRQVKKAISVARCVLENTQISMIAGELATKFAQEMGFTIESLTTKSSQEEFYSWRNKSCQPNYWTNVLPDPKVSCGPYKRGKERVRHLHEQVISAVSIDNHDTIGMIAIDSKGDMAVGTSTNGLNHKIAGRVGDTPIPGSGGYVDNDIGAAAATGDGDIMMRFVPSYQAVESMRLGLTPQQAAHESIVRIIRKYPSFEGAIVVANKSGHYAAACANLQSFPMTIGTPDLIIIINITCITSDNHSMQQYSFF